MNKYQEELKLAYEMMNAADFGSAKRGCEALKVLQELVEKATPKKPISKKVRHYAPISKYTTVDYYCPECHFDVYKEMNSCCECTQKLDWSDEYDR